ncbi:MAG TPA: 2-amino-4-hydroxy-6-hydroxymethyldihydropteridine diphosphokinase [Marinobacterium sp.]|nr:2-amino-4-hydroxy-6-hydroxymethyldihydropteridine diphosphokinase [Marinobacterium sp.]
MAFVILGLGSNMDAENRLSKALVRLDQELDSLAISPWFESHALRGGANYLNLVATANTLLSIEDLHHLLHRIEEEQGRTRGDEDQACALDIDLICYDRQQIRTAEYCLPRSDITEHAHVLWPLAELCPEQTHPCLGISYSDLWQERREQMLETQALWPIKKRGDSD